MQLEEFVAGFLLEADEHLHSVNRNLVAVADGLKQGRAEPRAVRELFRSLHTIKGLASMVGAEPIADIAHEMESILRSADQAGGRLAERALDSLLQGTRAIEERVHQTAKGGVRAIVAAPPQLLEALTSIHDAVAQPAAAARALALPEELGRSLSTADREQAIQAVTAGRRLVLLEFQPSPERASRGVNITSVRSRLAGLGELIKVIPRSDPKAPTGIAFCLLLVTDAANAALAEAAGSPEQVISDVALESPPVDAVMPTALPPDVDTAELTPSDHSIRVDVRKLDEALERLSELVVTRFKLARVAAGLADKGTDVRELNTVLAEHGRQLRRLRAAITASRMVPLSELLQRLPLVVRGLTRDGKKTVNVSVQAGSAEVDKAVADRLFPAIVHMVRNAVDHALESEEERTRAQKPATGSLAITCDDSSGTNLVLRIRDDGRGIDRESVARKLGRAVAESDDELLQQITTPGLSTRDGVTHTSGRGMGMDIVKRTVELLGGGLSLETASGRGTTFTLQVPVSVTIVDVFSFIAGSQVFVAPVAMVDEIVEVERSRVVRSPAPKKHGPEPLMIERRGQAIPLFGLEALLSRRPQAELPAKALVVSQNRGTVALGVARMLGQQEVVVRPLNDALVRVTGVTGATDLGDGRPTLVLDLLTLGAAAVESPGVSS